MRSKHVFGEEINIAEDMMNEERGGIRLGEKETTFVCFQSSNKVQMYISFGFITSSVFFH